MFAAQCPKCGHSWRVRGNPKPGERISCTSCTNVFALTPLPLVTTTAPRERVPELEKIRDDLAHAAAREREDAVGDAPSLPAHLRITLEIIEGAQKGDVFELAKSRVAVGRGAGDISLSDKDVSRKHAVLEVYGDRYIFLRDLASTNGTYVNAMLISQAKLVHGDILRFGDTEMRLKIEKRQ